MPLDFPSSPTNGQTYGNYYYDATVGAWNSFSSTVNTVPSTLKNLSVTTDDVALVPLTVNGKSGQTANLQEWVSGAGSGVASLTNAGTLTVQTLNLTNDLTVANGGTGAGTFTTGAYLKGNGTSAIQAQTGVPLADVTVINIGSGADLNTYTTQGLYQQLANVNAAGGANYPVPYAGFLEVHESTDDNFIYQRYTAYREQHEVYIRARYASVWNAWQKLPAGTVTVAEGGTGATTLTSGAYLKGAGTSAITAQTGIPAGDITSGAIPYERFPAGTVVQVQSTTITAAAAYSMGAGALQDVGLNVTITPKSSTNKILVIANTSSAGVSFSRPGIVLLRNSTRIGVGNAAGSRNQISGSGAQGETAPGTQSVNFLDSPATTSAITYRAQIVNLHSATQQYNFNYDVSNNDNVAHGRTASTITVMEIVA